MGWLAGWGYRKSHVINFAAGAGTLYQKMITAHYGSGADGDDDVYLNSHCRTDFGDVRFTDDGGSTLLDYWMESKTDSDNAVFWVEVAGDLSTVAKTIYVYYGKSDATTTSNEVNTALSGYADDHEPTNSFMNSTVLVLSTEQAVSPTHSMKGTTAENGNYRHTPAVALPNLDLIRIRNWYRRAGTGTDPNNSLFVFKTSDDAAWCGSHVAIAGGAHLQWYQAGWHDSGYDSQLNVWELYEIEINFATSTFTVYVDGVAKITGASFIGAMTKAQTVYLHGGSACGAADQTHYYDNYFMRKYVSPEPSHGAWGTEEIGAVLKRLLVGVGL